MGHCLQGTLSGRIGSSCSLTLGSSAQGSCSGQGGFALALPGPRALNLARGWR